MDRLITIAAFRYALGRQSYMVDHVASYIERHADALASGDKLLIIREIDEQAETGSLGMAMDADRWRRVQRRLRASAHPDGGHDG